MLAWAHLVVEVVCEEHEDLWGTDLDLAVQKVGAQLHCVPLPKEMGINLYWPVKST